MLSGGDDRFRDLIASTIGWWAGAGVDAPIAEDPRDWLVAPTKRPEPASRSVEIAPLAAPAVALPDNLATLHALLCTGDYAPGAALPRRRVGPAGDPAAGLMIVADMPDQDDPAAGLLFSGETQRLFEAMLAAMGRSRETVYLAPLSPSRLAGRPDPAHVDALAALMRRHIALVAPKGLILFGDAPCRALLGMERGQARGGLHRLNYDCGTVPTIALVHPRMLLRHPALKADAWSDMRLMIGDLSQWSVAT